MSSRPRTLQAHERLFSRVLHGRLATEQDAKPDSFAAHVSAPSAPGAVQAISSPPENYAFHMEAAAQKNLYPFPKLMILGLLAGAYISMGYSLCSLVGGQLSKEFRLEQPGAFNFLFGIFGFPMGLTLCVVAGADLFTSNCMYATIAVAEGRYGLLGLLRCWLVSYFCNLLGSLIMVGLMIGGDVFYGTRKDFVIDLALAKTSHSFGVTFCKGILCNWLVCLAVWQGNMARDLTGKFVGIFLPNSAFVSMGFEHCVANMYLIPLSMALGSGISVGTFITKNLIPATLGNIVGGAGFVGMAYALSFGTPGHEVFEAWEHALACMPCVGRLAPQPALPSRAPPRHSDTLGYGAHGGHGNGAFDEHMGGPVLNGFSAKPPTMHRMPTSHLPPSPVAEERDGSLESGKTGSTNPNGSMLRGS